MYCVSSPQCVPSLTSVKDCNIRLLKQKLSGGYTSDQVDTVVSATLQGPFSWPHLLPIFHGCITVAFFPFAHLRHLSNTKCSTQFHRS